MLQKEYQTNPAVSIEFIEHLKSSRGNKWFPNVPFRERLSECVNAILNPNIGAIVEDIRSHTSSTHSCLFVNNSGENIALVLGINDSGLITLITIKNIAECESGSSWFYDQYEKVAAGREMQSMNRIWRPENANK